MCQKRIVKDKLYKKPEDDICNRLRSIKMNNRYICEVLISSLYIALGIVPFAYIRYYPFLDKLRFSKLKTVIVFLMLVLLDIYIFIRIERHGNFFVIEHSGVFRLSFFIIYFIFSCISINENFFKHLLVYLICFMFISTLTTMVYVASNIFYSDILHLTYVLIMIVLAVPFTIWDFMFTKKVLTPLINKADVKTIMLVCFILIIISIINGFSTYDLSWKQSIPTRYIIIRIFSFLGTIGVIKILKTLVEEQQNRLTLSEECKRHEVLLAVQKEQFYSLSEKIEETRRIRHDLKHHFAAVQNFLIKKEYDKLSEYIEKEISFVPNNEKFIFCDNITVNTILSYYYKKAKESNILMEVRVSIPNGLKVEDMELWVLFGNLLENAIEGCERITDTERIIKVKAYYKDNILFILADNPVNEELIKKLPNGFVSSKNSNMHGLGIGSICFLAEKLGGKADFEVTDGWFLASVYINVMRDIESCEKSDYCQFS